MFVVGSSVLPFVVRLQLGLGLDGDIAVADVAEFLLGLLPTIGFVNFSNCANPRIVQTFLRRAIPNGLSALALIAVLMVLLVDTLFLVLQVVLGEKLGSDLVIGSPRHSRLG